MLSLQVALDGDFDVESGICSLTQIMASHWCGSENVECQGQLSPSVFGSRYFWFVCLVFLLFLVSVVSLYTFPLFVVL